MARLVELNLVLLVADTLVAGNLNKLLYECDALITPSDYGIRLVSAIRKL